MIGCAVRILPARCVGAVVSKYHMLDPQQHGRVTAVMFGLDRLVARLSVSRMVGEICVWGIHAPAGLSDR